MSLGKFIRLDIRGASHASRLSFSLANFPSGVVIDRARLRAFMARRAPGRDKLSTARRETDEVAFASGVKGGITTGETICGTIANRDARPGDYGASRTIPRPGHADFGQWVEMGRIPTGGGKNSGRMTACLCAAGGLCLQWLETRGVSVTAEIESVRGATGSRAIEAEIRRAKASGDSVGGLIRCTLSGLPPGLGGALEAGLESAFAESLFSIPGVKAVEFGEGIGDARHRRGSEANDAFCIRNGVVVTKTNRQGGIMGGRATGMPVVFRVAMRPTPTVFTSQTSVDLATMKPAKCVMKGRHDPCIVRRALPVVEAATAIAVMDAILADEAAHPRICLTLTGKTLAEDLAQYASQRYFTDMVELRVDLLKKSERTKVAEFPEMLAKSSPWKVPVVLTFRRACDGGAFKGGEGERARFFTKMLGAGFDYVDLEEGFGGKELVKLAREAGTKVVRSLHAFDGPVANVRAKLRELGKNGDIAKIAFQPRDLADVARVFRELPHDAPPHVVCAMGSQGLATRVLAGRLGSCWTYASVGGLEGLGHVTPHELVRDYRFRSISNGATLYGVTGWPLAKTRSPEINNAAFAAEDDDAVMIPFPAKTAKEALRFMKALGMRGMAVTIPHKFAIQPLLDKVDAFAKRVGAVNTVVREARGYIGYNTDVEGFAEALSTFAPDLRGKTAAILGDGGAAQAVKVALKTLGVAFKVFHRATPPQGFDILINATPVDPIPDYVFTGRELVYDLRYVPEVTPLLARAAAAGCRVENGFSMLLAQAVGQRRLFSKGVWRT